jgi:competence protein ComEC
LPIALFTALGYLSIQPWLGIELPDDHVRRFTGPAVWRIEGRVHSAVVARPPRWEFLLDAEVLQDKARRHMVRGRIKVSGRGDPPDVAPEDAVAFKGRLRTIRNFENPGGFNYERYMALRRVHARVYARRGSLERISPAARSRWRGLADHLRRRLANQMETALADHAPETVGLLQALILGNRSKMTDDQQEAFRRAGVGHVLAISGLHIGCVAFTAFAVFKWLLSWFPPLVQRAWTRKGAAVLSLGFAAVYGLLAGWSPSTQRAILMVAVCLSGTWVGRRHDWFSALALAAIAILIVSPPSLFSISFQLSFAAVLAIVAGLQIYRIHPSAPDGQRWMRWGKRVLAFAWVSVLAIAGTLPLVLYYFNEVSLAGLLTNFIVVPVVAALVVPAGLLGALVSAVSADLAGLVWHIAAMGLAGISWVVVHVAHWPWAAVRSVTPTPVEIGLYYCFLGGSLFWKKLPRRGPAIAVFLLLVCLDVGYWSHERFFHHELRITAVDVGQGSANLLEMPGGFTALIDGGGFSDNRSFDVGARLLAPLLWRRKIRTIDLVVLTHPNSDHLNGLLFVLRHFNVKAVWSNHEPADMFGYRQWRTILAQCGIPHRDYQTLPAVVERNGVRIEVLAPPRDFLKRRRTETWRDTNADSMVLRVGYGKISALIPGDITARTEADLLRRYSTGQLCSTILIVPHHGSRKSSSMPFLAAVKPKEAVISAGWQNRFGFPHQETLDRLAAVGSRVWITGDSGAVRIVTDGDSYRVRTQRR